jgi:hypothetical protein
LILILIIEGKVICVEPGLVEEAKSFRGSKDLNEPLPNWTPLVLPPSSLSEYSDKLDLSHPSLVEVRHLRDPTLPNSVRELPVDGGEWGGAGQDEVTSRRCEVFLERLVGAEDEPGGLPRSVLLVCHGAVVDACAR